MQLFVFFCFDFFVMVCSGSKIGFGCTTVHVTINNMGTEKTSDGSFEDSFSLSVYLPYFNLR